MERPSERVAIVTGGAGGIGSAVTRALAAEMDGGVLAGAPAVLTPGD
ncbi:hypothetical protein [Streptomyces variegatus]|jgi:NAD(P)-dependent dehydrogenase (short-subunit alcohol dehydrogenase family)